MGAVGMILFLLPFITVTFAYKNLRFRSDSGISGRIVGGHAGHIDDFPFMVKLTIDLGDEEAVCGGSYIKPVWVLTAAHCLDINDSDDTYPPEVGDDLRRVKCIMGMENQWNIMYQKRRSVNLYINPMYFRNATEVFNDIGLIQLKRPFKLTSSVQMVPIPTEVIDYGGQTVTLMGWGATQKSDRPSEGIFTAPYKLQVLDTLAHDMDECANLTGSDSVICIGEEGKVSCSGDSGGPLVFNDMVIGVCSYGFGCSGQFAVYENVYSHGDWINETTTVIERQSMLEDNSAQRAPGKLVRLCFCLVVLIVCPMVLN